MVRYIMRESIACNCHGARFRCLSSRVTGQLDFRRFQLIALGLVKAFYSLH